MSMPFALDVGSEISSKLLLYTTILIVHSDTQTAIFKETTSYMTPWDELNRKHPFNGPGLPDDIARLAVVLASDDANWLTGVLLPVDGGYTAR